MDELLSQQSSQICKRLFKYKLKDIPANINIYDDAQQLFYVPRIEGARSQYYLHLI